MRGFFDSGWFLISTGGLFLAIGIWMLREGEAFGWLVIAFNGFVVIAGFFMLRGKVAGDQGSVADLPRTPSRNLASPALFLQVPMAETEAQAIQARLRDDLFQDLEVAGVRFYSIEVPVNFSLHLGRIEGTSSSLHHALNRFRKKMLFSARHQHNVAADGQVMIGDEMFTMMPIEEEFEEYTSDMQPLDLQLCDVVAGIRRAVSNAHWNDLPDWFREPIEAGDYSKGLAFSPRWGDPSDAIVRFRTGFLYCYFTEL